MNPSRFVSLLAACAAGVALLPSAAANPRIGVLLKGRSGFWQAVGKGATDAAAKAGAEVIVKAPPRESDVSVQIALLRGLSKQGLSALLIAPANKEALLKPVNAIAATGVKVVVLDDPLAGQNSFAFVGTDERAEGAAAGDLLARFVGDGDEVAILRHNQVGGATSVREIVAMDKLHAAHAAVRVHGDIYASTHEGAEAKQARLLLTRYPNTKVVFACAAPGTLAMLQTLKDRKASARLIGYGFNLNPEVVAGIRSGILAGWIAQLPGDIGAKGVAAALEEVAGRPPARIIRTGFVVVTKDNVDDAPVKALLAL